MRRGDPNAATEMGVMCLGLAEGESEQRPSIFWKLASAFMQALGVQAAWALALGALGVLLWRQNQKRLVLQGG